MTESRSTVNLNAVWDAGQEPDREWVDRTWVLLQPYSTGVYVNILDAEGTDRVSATYGPAAPRLRAPKQRLGADNVFRHNHNIAPAPVPEDIAGG